MTNKTYDRLLKTLWNREIKSLNEHLPQRKKFYWELIKEEKPYIFTKAGDKLYFNRQELLELGKYLSEQEKNNLSLPLILIRRIELGRGVYTISGGKTEIELINKLLKETGSESIITFSSPYLYRPQLYNLKKKYRTIITIGFGSTSPTEKEY